MSFSVTNLLHEGIPVPGVTDSTLALTAASVVRPSSTVTLNSATQLLLLTIVGDDAWFTHDGTAPAVNAGHPWYNGQQLWLNASNFATFRVIGASGSSSIRISQLAYRQTSYRAAVDMEGRISSRTFWSLYSTVVRHKHQDPTAWLADTEAGSPGLKELIATWIEARVEHVWRHDFWPDLIQDIPATVEDDDGVLQVLFDDLDLINPGEVIEVFVQNPSKYGNPATVTWRATGYGIVITSGAAADDTVYVRVRPVPPRFTIATYDGATAYSPGDVVYYGTTKDCYLCIASTTGNAPTSLTHWQRQLIPEWMSAAVVHGVLADWELRDGQAARIAETYEDKFTLALLRMHDTRVATQRRHPHAIV